VFGVYFASETAQVELESERVKAPAVSMEQRGSPALSPVQSSARPVAPSIRGLHPSTSQLNVSVFWGAKHVHFPALRVRFSWVMSGGVIVKSVSG
jgi:hypothetical protein